MRDQKWIGLGPFDYCWSADSKTLFFSWNPEARNEPELYALDVASAKYRKTDKKQANHDIEVVYRYNNDRSLGIAEKEGDLYCYEVKRKKSLRLTNTNKALQSTLLRV
jgi:hypothetical protein